MKLTKIRKMSTDYTSEYDVLCGESDPMKRIFEVIRCECDPSVLYIVTNIEDGEKSYCVYNPYDGSVAALYRDFGEKEARRIRKDLIFDIIHVVSSTILIINIMRRIKRDKGSKRS